MFPTLALCAFFPLVVADPALPGGTQLTYRGRITSPDKTFDLLLLISGADDQGAKLYWAVEENGKATFPWAERFGEIALNAAWQPVSEAAGPAVIYDYETGTSVVPVPIPFFVKEGLKTGLEWEADGLNYEVQKETDLDRRKVWQIVSSDNVGRRRLMYRDKTSPLLPGVDQQVFMNMGTEYLLSLRLVGSEKLSDADFQSRRQEFAALVKFRSRLKRPARYTKSELSEADLATLQVELPALQKTITSGPLLKVLRAAEADLKQQSDRAGGVSKLVDKFKGKPVPKFALDMVSGNQKLKSEDLKGQVTVLHFWDYRSEPLEEPYGQVGYLDFLYGKRKEAGVKVFGVVVDDRLAEGDEKSAVLRGVRKFKSFMNLGYPLALDDGSLLKELGDPRTLGAKLPLYLVIGPDGHIVQYHVGFHQVDRDRGLKALDDAIEANLPKKE